MEAVIVNYRRGRHTQTTNQVILSVESITDVKKAQTLVGKSVSWHAPGKDKKIIKGKVTSPHGANGCVKALFERGLPGQSLGTKIKLE